MPCWCSPAAAAKRYHPKDYTQIIHDAREAEDNDYYMIFSPAEDGKFIAQYGYSASYPADDLNDEIQNMLLPCWICPRAATPILPPPSLP